MAMYVGFGGAALVLLLVAILVPLVMRANFVKKQARKSGNSVPQTFSIVPFSPRNNSISAEVGHDEPKDEFDNIERIAEDQLTP